MQNAKCKNYGANKLRYSKTKRTSWSVLNGRQRAAPNVDVRAAINRLFTPRWESNFVERFGWWYQNAIGSTCGIVRETLPYSKRLWNSTETLHNHLYINALKVLKGVWGKLSQKFSPHK